MSGEWFWSIICYAVLLGIGGLVGLVFLWWLVVVPMNEVPPTGRRRHPGV